MRQLIIVLAVLVLACGCTVNHSRYYGRLMEDLNCPLRLKHVPLIDVGSDRLCLSYFTIHSKIESPVPVDESVAEAAEEGVADVLAGRVSEVPQGESLAEAVAKPIEAAPKTIGDPPGG